MNNQEQRTRNQERFSIRTMSIRDYAAVLALWKNTPGICLDDSDSCPAIARLLRRNPGCCFVACAEDEIVGAVLSAHDGRRGFIYHLAVATSHRKHGLGRALVAHCLRALAKNKIPKCSLFVLPDNTIGKRFWQNSGWTRRINICVFQKKI
jgi:ribosomal protein S18 acetylase RimI-like enzyme